MPPDVAAEMITRAELRSDDRRELPVSANCRDFIEGLQRTNNPDKMSGKVSGLSRPVFLVQNPDKGVVIISRSDRFVK